MRRISHLLSLLLLILVQFSFCQMEDDFGKALEKFLEEGEGEGEGISQFLKNGHLPSEDVPPIQPVAGEVRHPDAQPANTGSWHSDQLHVTRKRMRGDHELVSGSQVSATEQLASRQRQRLIDGGQPRARSPQALPLTPSLPPLTEQERLSILDAVGKAHRGNARSGALFISHPAGAGQELTPDLIKEALGDSRTLLRNFEGDIYLVPSKRTSAVPQASIEQGGMMLTGPREKHVYVWKRIQPSDKPGSILQLVGALQMEKPLERALGSLPTYSTGRIWEAIGRDSIYDETLLKIQ
ncbi:conserved hypothetical Ustilaginaceae-specific protein [Sporisorium reilianum SRZ2]|uniref:Conserved hypothetical Ustilaginaceae-specific protein n=1 Tax=Sporisorium reilianum (strain SRZ2) TaxID=999809 RepID=E6ZUX1_SPORE|nr:conserved hypothetical Ustilaginaceae-specific protein [Sporisorium reilianum SRZ2]